MCSRVQLIFTELVWFCLIARFGDRKDYLLSFPVWYQDDIKAWQADYMLTKLGEGFKKIYNFKLWMIFGVLKQPTILNRFFLVLVQKYFLISFLKNLFFFIFETFLEIYNPIIQTIYKPPCHDWDDTGRWGEGGIMRSHDNDRIYVAGLPGERGEWGRIWNQYQIFDVAAQL